MSVPGTVLRPLPLLADCDADDLDALGLRLHYRPFVRGEQVWREGDAAGDFGLLVEGRVSVTRSGPSGVEVLGIAGPGAVLGELALLRSATRIATVTAQDAGLLVVGDGGALEALLDLPGVHDRMRLVAGARLARDAVPVPATTADGTQLLLRPLLPADRPAYTAAIGELSAESLRRRFFSAGQPTSRMIDYLVDVDYVDHFVWVALLADQPETGIATARYVRSRDDAAAGEIALAVVDDWHGHGVGRLLLGAVGVAARAAGIRRLVAVVQVDNTAMKSLLDQLDARYELTEPGVEQAVVPASAAAELIGAELRAQLHRACAEVVTAAGLALT